MLKPARQSPYTVRIQDECRPHTGGSVNREWGGVEQAGTDNSGQQSPHDLAAVLEVVAARALRNRSGQTPASRVIDEALTEAILDGNIPAGSWLNEQEIAKAFNVSRTPAREAMKALDGKQLTQAGPNHTRVVASLSVDDVDTIFLVREVLEGLAARIVATRHGTQVGARLAEINKELELKVQGHDVAELSELNREFHRTLWLATDSQQMIRILSNIHNGLRRLPSGYEIPGAVEESIQDHKMLIDALIDGDGNRAEEAAKHHAQKGHQRRTRMIIGRTQATAQSRGTL